MAVTMENIDDWTPKAGILAAMTPRKVPQSEQLCCLSDGAKDRPAFPTEAPLTPSVWSSEGKTHPQSFQRAEGHGTLE